MSDVTAFSEFVEARTPSLFRTAYLMVGDHQLAQDLLQEALVKTLIAWPRLRDHPDLEAYTARSWSRRRSRGGVAGASMNGRPTRCPRRSPGPVEAVATHDAVVAALLTVPPRQRAAIVLRYYQDLTEAQTAEVMGCSVGTVKSQVAAGLTAPRVARWSFDELEANVMTESLGELLRRTADAVRDPHLDVAELVARAGRRQRHRRLAVVAGAAALVGAVVVGSFAFRGTSAEPEPAPSPPRRLRQRRRRSGRERVHSCTRRAQRCTSATRPSTRAAE